MGLPFGESIAQLATYLCYVHAISYQRLCPLFRDVFGLQISEGALANLFRRVQGRLGDMLEEIRARVRASRVVKSDETGPRVQGRKAGEWVYIGEGAVLHVVAPSRAKREPEAVLDGARPEVWVADLFGSQQGHGESGGRCAWRTSCGTCSTRSTRGTRCSRRRCWHGCSGRSRWGGSASGCRT